MEAREAEEGEIQEEMDEVEAEIAKKARQFQHVTHIIIIALPSTLAHTQCTAQEGDVVTQSSSYNLFRFTFVATVPSPHTSISLPLITSSASHAHLSPIVSSSPNGATAAKSPPLPSLPRTSLLEPLSAVLLAMLCAPALQSWAAKFSARKSARKLYCLLVQVRVPPLFETLVLAACARPRVMLFFCRYFSATAGAFILFGALGLWFGPDS
jgi:hypothetical protein